jgi:hypothetical protein
VNRLVCKRSCHTRNVAENEQEASIRTEPQKVTTITLYCLR